jgi:two-component system, sensor histidine kinase YesM
VLFINKIQKKYMNLKISTKIMLIYLLFLIFSVSLSSFVYQKIYYDITSKKVSDLSLQTLYSIKSNIYSMIDNVSYNSKIILSSNTVQGILRDSQGFGNIDSQRAINSYLTNLMDSMPYITSIYIFDNFGNRYGIDKYSLKNFKFKRVEESNWYRSVLDKKGYFILKLNAGQGGEKNNNQNYISLIRAIYNLDVQKQQLGTLMINISENGFVNCYSDIESKYGTGIMLLDEENASIVKQKSITNSDIINKQLESLSEKEYNSFVDRVNGQEYIFSTLRVEKLNWKIISRIPFRELTKESAIFNFVALGVILINGVLLFIGAILVSKLITIPIKKLLKSMKSIENGEFKRVDIETGNDEIGRLRDGYNIMISEIEKLINRVVEEQRIKRQVELNVLQAQIKPHFLYNTLDTMGYLAISGKSDEVYEAIEALGSYYRTSLSKGSEVISIREEIEIVKNYLTLQKFRYGDTFNVNYEIDERVYEYKILKLVLQPLVENALYHGIKPKGEMGHITVTTIVEDDLIRISVADDGIGMTDEELVKIIDGRLDNNNSSLGLRGTIERLKIFYGVSDVYSIESRKRYGTRVTLKIPIVEGGEKWITIC